MSFKEFGWNDELIEGIKCPKCNGEKYDCIETEFYNISEDVYAVFRCKNCGAYFSVRYVAANIEFMPECDE